MIIERYWSAIRFVRDHQEKCNPAAVAPPVAPDALAVKAAVASSPLCEQMNLAGAEGRMGYQSRDGLSFDQSRVGDAMLPANMGKANGFENFRDALQGAMIHSRDESILEMLFKAPREGGGTKCLYSGWLGNSSLEEFLTDNMKTVAEDHDAADEDKRSTIERYKSALALVREYQKRWKPAAVAPPVALESDLEAAKPDEMGSGF